MQVSGAVAVPEVVVVTSRISGCNVFIFVLSSSLTPILLVILYYGNQLAKRVNQSSTQYGCNGTQREWIYTITIVAGALQLEDDVHGKPYTIPLIRQSPVAEVGCG